MTGDLKWLTPKFYRELQRMCYRILRNEYNADVMFTRLLTYIADHAPEKDFKDEEMFRRWCRVVVSKQCRGAGKNADCKSQRLDPLIFVEEDSLSYLAYRDYMAKPSRPKGHGPDDYSGNTVEFYERSETMEN